MLDMIHEDNHWKGIVFDWRHPGLVVDLFLFILGWLLVIWRGFDGGFGGQWGCGMGLIGIFTRLNTKV
jgi:hypothetical protein